MRAAARPVLILISGVVLCSGLLPAGDFHSGSTLICSDCHVMHASQSHGYADNGARMPVVGLSAGPHEYLLRREVNDLCLVCHDGQPFIADVLEANINTGTRQAGALNRGDAPYFEATGHTLGSQDLAPGDLAGDYVPGPGGLDCVNCHNPHGYGGSTADPYRNLAPLGGFGSGSVSYAVGTNDPSKDVFERTVARYEPGNVDLNEPDPAASGFASWCANCHGEFHGAVGGGEIGGGATGEFVRHPAAGVDIGALGEGHSSLDVYLDGSDPLTTKVNYVKVMTALEEWPVNGTHWTPTGPADDLTPTCITCHKGHGNLNAFGLIYMGDTGTVTDEGTAGGSYNDLCRQCHVQGGG